MVQQSKNMQLLSMKGRRESTELLLLKRATVIDRNTLAWDCQCSPQIDADSKRLKAVEDNMLYLGQRYAE
jgi:hypothetical protein